MLKKLARAQILSAHTAADAAMRDGALARTAHRADFSRHAVRPGFLYVRSRAISSRCNDNFDEFPAEEIAKSYKTFIGKPVFVNHVNHDTKRARGVVIDAALHRDRNPDGTPDTWVEVLMEVDGIRFPKLAKAILAKPPQVYETSMGCDVDYSICSACGNKATRPEEYCRHIPGAKGTPYAVTDHKTGTRQTSPIREICYGLRFFENSLLVEPPADPTAQLLGVDASGLDKTATAKTSDARDQHQHAMGLAEHLVKQHGYDWDELHGMSNWPIEAQKAFHEDDHGPDIDFGYTNPDRPRRKQHLHTAAQLEAEAAWGGDGSAQPNIRDQIPHIPSRTVRSPHAEPGHDDPVTQQENTRVDAPTGNTGFDELVNAISRPRHERDLPEGVAGASQKLPANYMPHLPHPQRFLRYKWENANRLEIGRDDGDEPILQRITPAGRDRTRAWVRQRWTQATGLPPACDHPGCPPWECRADPNNRCSQCGKPHNFIESLLDHEGIDCDDALGHHGRCCPNRPASKTASAFDNESVSPIPAVQILQRCTQCGHATGHNPDCRACRKARELYTAADDIDHGPGGLADEGHRMRWQLRSNTPHGPILHGTCHNCWRTMAIGRPGMAGDNQDAPQAYHGPCPNPQLPHPAAHEMDDLAADRLFNRAAPGRELTRHQPDGHAQGLVSQNARTAAYDNHPGPDDGYVYCDHGHCHWDPDRTGAAAGMLIHHQGHVLLGRRALHTDYGGTWGIPAGALQHGETPAQGAMREATEELGPLPQLRPTGVHRDDHGNWAFHTHIAEADHPFHPEGGDDETDEFAWVHPRDFANYDLHPGLAATWPHLAPRIRGARRTAAGEDTSYRFLHTAPDSTGVPLHRLYHPSSDNILRSLQNGQPGDEETGNAAAAADGRPRARIKIYRAVPAHVTTINPGDWITLSPHYARKHAQGRKGHHVLATTVEARHIHTDGNDVLEWGYNGPAKEARVHWRPPVRPVTPDYAGGAVQLSPEDHDFVHGTAPVADRAHRLMQAIPRWGKDTGPYSTGAMHSNKGSYTDNRSEAHYDAQDNADNLPDADRPKTLFMLHAPQNSRAITGISFTQHTPPETPLSAYTSHTWNPDEVDEDTGMRHTATTTRQPWWQAYDNPTPTRTTALRTQAMPPKFKNPGEHPFFKEHPVSARHVLTHWADATEEEKNQGERWYSDAHLLAHALAHTYANGDTGKAAGVISAYSPRTSWAANMHNAARSLASGRALKVGEGLSIMGVHHSLADKIMNGEDYDKVLKGPKTNAFAKLIHHGGIDPVTGTPMPHVVIDRHALSVAAGHRLSEDDAAGFPSSTPHYYNHVAKTYADAADAIAKAEGRTVAPHQVQAVTWLVRIRKNRAEDLHERGGGGKGRATNQENQLRQWRELHPKLLPGGAGPDNMHMSGRTGARRRVEGVSDDDGIDYQFGLQHLGIKIEAADERDYLMQHEAPDASAAPLHDLAHPINPAIDGGSFPEDVYDHPEMYTGYPDDHEMLHSVRRARGNPDAKIRIYRAVPKGTQHINTGDWVTLSKEYAKEHARSMGDGIVLRTMSPAHHLHTEGNDLQEWAYHGPQQIGMSSWVPKGYKHRYPWETDPNWEKNSKLAYGETKAPAQVDTLRDDACMVCGNTEGWDGINCPVCLFKKPPDLFMDPDTSVARTMDLRGVGDDAAQMALQQGADVVPGGVDQSGEQLPGGDPAQGQVPGGVAEGPGGEMEDPGDATADGEVRTLGDGTGQGDPAAQEAEGQTDVQVANGEGEMSPSQMPPDAQDVLSCPACGFQTPAGPPVSTITDDPSVPASAGPVAGDVCPNCGKAVLVSSAEEAGLTPPPEVAAIDPQAADVQAAPGEEPISPQEGASEGPEQGPDDGGEDEETPKAQSKPKSPAVKRVASRIMGQMIDLYHRTTPENARQIMQERRMISKEHDGGVYFSNRRDSEYSNDYGAGVVHVRVPEHLAQPDDEFADGEMHYKILDRDLQPHHFIGD